jgi:hypothetical protein
MWLPFISKDKYLQIILQEEYYPIRDKILNASPGTLADP